MKNDRRDFEPHWGGIVSLLLFTSISATAQTFLNSIPGLSDKTVMPDFQRSDTPIAVPIGSEYWKRTIHLATSEEVFYSPALAEIDFSVDTDMGPIGLAGSDVALEQAVPENAEDDFYLSPPWGSNRKTFDENVPLPPGSPIIPALNLGTGNGENTDGYCFGINNYLLPNGWTVEDGTFAMHDAVVNGQLFIQFTVDPTAIGLFPSAVNTEAARLPPEAGGDVFESLPPGGGNSHVADEAALGLEDLPQDDTNSLVIPDDHLLDGEGQNGTTPPFAGLTLAVDTNGDGLFDAPTVYFSIKNGGTFGNVGGDIYMTPPWTGLPTLNPAWLAPALGLQAGIDEIDALYIENPNGTYPLIYFSLARGSGSLALSPGPIRNPFNGTGFGADCGDIIAVVVQGQAGNPGALPIVGPQVVIPAGTLGLVGDLDPSQDGADDDLNGLHMTMVQLGQEVEVPTETPTETDTSTATPTEAEAFTDTPTPTDTATPGSVTPTPTDTPPDEPTPTPTYTEASLETPTDTETPLATSTPTETEAIPATSTPTAAGSVSPTSTPTDPSVPTSTPSLTNTQPETPTPTETLEGLVTPTNTGTPESTPTFTNTGGTLPTPTPTPTEGGMGDPSSTPTPTETATSTEGTGPTFSPTPTELTSASPTSSNTPSEGATPTATGSADPTSTPSGSPEPCSNSCDLNGDEIVDARDVLEFICQCRGMETTCERLADFNCDHEINWQDLMILQSEWR